MDYCLLLLTRIEILPKIEYQYISYGISERAILYAAVPSLGLLVVNDRNDGHICVCTRRSSVARSASESWTTWIGTGMLVTGQFVQRFCGIRLGIPGGLPIKRVKSLLNAVKSARVVISWNPYTAFASLLAVEHTLRRFYVSPK